MIFHLFFFRSSLSVQEGCRHGNCAKEAFYPLTDVYEQSGGDSKTRVLAWLLLDVFMVVMAGLLSLVCLHIK